MQELEKILYELEKRIFTAEVYNDDFDGTTITNLICLGDVRDILEKHMNDGWIPVERELPPNAKHKGAFCPKVRVMTKFGETYGWYNPDCESWYILVWFMTKRYLDGEIDFERGDKPKIARLPDQVNDTKHILFAWQPLPEPCRPEQPETCKYTSGSCCYPIDQCRDCPYRTERRDNHDRE